MAGLIPWPWKKRKSRSTTDGGAVVPVQEFPALVHRLQREFDELFDRFVRDWPLYLSDFRSGWRWGLDFEDREDAYVVRAEAPGFEAGDFDINVSGEQLVLRASRKSESKEKGAAYSQQMECYECFTLPPGVDKDKIEARYHNGVLTLTLPKTKEGRGKKIAVKAS
jgi:HSP20 family protein